jgi:Zn-dependent peptidase ImmA (M78 family)
MATSIPSNATPRMLSWARTSARLDVADVAAAEKLAIEQIEAWERGDASPTLARLRKLAKRYKRPLMVFYLAEPPKAFNVVRDFRFLPEDFDREFSPELTLAIRRAQERQAWASSYLMEERAEPVALVRSVTLNDNPSNVSEVLRHSLGLSLDRQTSAKSESEAYGQWRRAIENAGVFVFQASGVPVKEMRGFALPDNYAPAIILNSQDFYRPKSFTLLHELAHILIGESAVSGSGDYAFSVNPNRQAERFCNQVAAATLVPADDFAKHVPRDWRRHDDEVVKGLSRRYWVSRDVIRLRLVELGFVGQEYVEAKQIPFTPKKKSKGGPIPQSTLAIARVGESFSRVALGAYQRGEIHGGELTSLLGMTLKHLPKLEAALMPTRLRGNAS